MNKITIKNVMNLAIKLDNVVMSIHVRNYVIHHVNHVNRMFLNLYNVVINN